MNWIDLKREILETAESDFIFSTSLVANVKRYLGIGVSNDTIRDVTLRMLREYMEGDEVLFYHVSGDKVEMVEYETENDINGIIKKVGEEWAAMEDFIPLPNQLFWLQSKENGDRELTWSKTLFPKNE